MKNTHRLIVPCALALTLCLPGCRRAPAEADGPSDYFRMLDANHDGDVDRHEWEVIRGPVFPYTLSFRYADCDMDGRLTWHEYAAGYMSSARCPAPFLYEDARGDDAARADASAIGSAGASFAHADDAQGEDWQIGPLVVRADEQVQIYEASPSERDGARVDVPTPLGRKQSPPRTGRHSEADLTPAALLRVRFSSLPVTDTVLVSHYDARETAPGDEVRHVFPLAVCKLANDNSDLRITLADLQIVWRVRGRQYRTRVLKTLWTNPGAAQLFHVWFNESVDAAECRLLHARGQPAA
jgi:hypothetical protein